MNWLQILQIVLQLEPLILTAVIQIATAIKHAPPEVQQQAVQALATLLTNTKPNGQ